MLQPILTLPSGTELKGGSPGSAVKSLTLHTAVNSGQEFTIGSAFSDYIEAEIWADPGSSLQITAGDALTYYRQDDAGSRTKVGVFYAEKPTRTKRNSYKVTAYDTMSKLDADFSGWLRANQAQFPKTIWQLVQLACQRAGVTLASSSLPINGSYSVQAFYADDLTCRQIISWAAEAAGCYAHMNADGRLQFLTYTDKRSTAKITPDGASNSTAYYADSLSYEDYTVKAIEKVQIRQSDSDVGVIYPDSTTATNTYVVQGNLLLTTGTESNLKSVVQNLYNVLKNVTYTPCKVSAPSSSGLACGQIVHVKDARGREFDTYLMSATISSGKASFESVGSASRESSSAVNSQSYKNLTGKMLEIKTSVDGLEVKASDLTGKYTDLKATVDGLSAEVKKDTKITGGGNLILGSDNWNNAAVDAGGNATSKTGGYTINGETVRVVNKAQNTRFRFAADTSMAIVKGVTYCASVLYKLNSGTDRLFLQFETLNGSTRTTYAAAFKENQQDIALENGWKMRYAVFTATADGYADQLFVSTTDDFSTVTCDITLMHPMVQMGNAPTAWNASSGDYLTQESAKSLFSQTADEIKTEVTKSVTETVTANVKDTATSAANDAVDSKLQDYATTATVESLKEDVSNISQKADGISTKVSSLEETTTTISDDLDSTKREFKTVKESVSAIDQKANSITQTVTQRITGGNNIITGTDDWNNATLDAGGNATSKTGSYTISGESVHVTNRAQNTRFHFGADKTLVIAKGMTYCASVLYKLNSGTDSLFLQFETKSSSGTKSYYGSAFKQAQQDIALDNGWKLRWAAFTATADGYADGLFVSTANDGTTVTNDLTIMHPMVQMGNAPTAWTASTGDYLTTAETKTEIKQTFDTIKLTASTSGTSSTIKLTAGGTEITSAQINLSGVVTFSDLSTWNQDKTIINGGNITTGQIHNLNYTTVYDLDNAWIRMGTSDGNRVYIDKSGIQWYGGTATSSGMSQGVIQNGLKTTTEGDTTIFCADTRYQKYGWWHDSSFQGITIEQVDNSVGCSGKLEVNQGIQCRSLSAWDAKNRIVRTDFGNLAINAVESPEPMFCDAGSGECDETGLCYIATEPRYRETVSETQDLRWALTPTGASAALWAEKTAFGAVVHGPAGQRFDWVCWGVQRGFEGVYADVSDAKYPEEENQGAYLLDAAQTEAAVSLPLTIEEAS